MRLRELRELRELCELCELPVNSSPRAAACELLPASRAAAPRDSVYSKRGRKRQTGLPRRSAGVPNAVDPRDAAESAGGRPSGPFPLAREPPSRLSLSELDSRISHRLIAGLAG